jgi:hypothetical protein
VEIRDQGDEEEARIIMSDARPLWPEARTERLRRLVRAGVSDPDIAAALGISLRAVIGKRQRLGFRRIERERPAAAPIDPAPAP